MSLTARYRHYLMRKDYLRTATLSFILFCLSICSNYAAGAYATAHASNYVQDIVLSNIPAYNVDGLFVWGTFLLAGFVLLLCLAHPKQIPFVLYSLALFYFTRSVFVTLTHLGAYPDRVPIDEGALLDKLFGGADFFFSGHTGAPFLLSLVYWRVPALRYIFIGWAVFMASVVLLGHMHYSIDVLAAFFITYSIFSMTEWLFPKERALFHSDEPHIT